MYSQTRSNKRDFIGDILKYLPSLIIPAITGILLLPITTRLFSTASYGNYALSISALNVLQLITNAWLNTTIIRFYDNSSSQGKAKYLHSTAFLMILFQSAVISFLCLVLVLAIRSRLEVELYKLLLIVPIQMVASNLMSLPLQIMRARRQIGLYTLLNAARYVLPPIAGIILSLLYSKSPIGMFTGSTILLWLIALLSYGLGFGNKQPSFKFFDRPLAIKLAVYGIPLIPAVLMVQVLDVSDRFIIGAYRGSVEVGLYSASYGVTSQSLQLLTTLITSAAAPLVVQIWERQGRQATEIFLRFITRIMFLICLPGLVGLIMLSKEIVLILSTPDYIAGAKIIPYVAIGVFLLGLQWIGQRGMILANKTALIMWMYIIAGVFNLMLNMLLVPRYGYIAAAWTTLGSYAMLFILIIIGSAPYLSWRFPVSSILRSLGGCIVMGLVIWFLSYLPIQSVLLKFMIKIIIGSLSYFVMLLITGEVHLERILSSFFSNGEGFSINSLGTRLK